MNVRSILNVSNRCFLIFGLGSLNYNQGKLRTTMMFYVLRCIIICLQFKSLIDENMIVSKEIDPHMFDLTSIIIYCCFEIMHTGKLISNVWRLFFDTRLSVILTKLEATHAKLIHLKVVRPMQIKINFLFITGIIVHLIASNILLIKWIISSYFINELAIIMDQALFSRVYHLNIFQATGLVSNICEFAAFYEYILLILYIRWLVYTINEQISQRHSTISTFRDMYLEVIECLNDINKSIYGLPAIWSFIGANVSRVVIILYYCLIFPRHADTTEYVACYTIIILIRLFNVILLYGIGDATEKEVNRMSLVLNERSTIERNPRIKRQIKFFILRRRHEHYHFKVFGIWGINLRQLLVLLNKAVGYLVVQSLFRLNRTTNI